MTVLTELFQVPLPWLYWPTLPKFHSHDCTDRIIPGSTAMTVLTELSQVRRPWLYWQNYSWFHGHDCTDRLIQGSTAMTVLTELSQVRRPWLYWQNYPRFHSLDCTDRIIPGSTALTALTEVSQVIRALCGVLSNCCQCQSVPFCCLHTRAVCLSRRHEIRAIFMLASSMASVCVSGGSLMSVWSILSKLWIGAFEGIVYINHVWIETAVCPGVVGEMPWPSCPSLRLLYHVLSNLRKDTYFLL